MPAAFTLTLARREDLAAIADHLNAHAKNLREQAVAGAPAVVAENRSGNDARAKAMKLVAALADAAHVEELAVLVANAEQARADAAAMTGE